MKEFLRIPMQFFAEETVETEPTGAASVQDDSAPQGTEPQKTDPAPAEKTFTQEEVNKLISERLARQQKQFDAKQEEAAKLAKMNAEQKAQYEAEKREKELSEREKAVKEKELRFEALNILAENNLPSKLVECLDLTSAETCNKSIENLKSAWAEALSAAVDARLKTNPPPAYSSGNSKNDAFLAGFMEG